LARAPPSRTSVRNAAPRHRDDVERGVGLAEVMSWKGPLIPERSDPAAFAGTPAAV